MPLLAIPDQAALRELVRPWKLLTFCIPMSWLIYGALYYHIGDWDLGITLLMGSLTYALAPSGVRALWQSARQPSAMSFIDALCALLIAWLVIDGVYVAYHTLMGNPIYRVDNIRASTPLYFMGGLGWLYRGSLAELIGNLRSLRG